MSSRKRRSSRRRDSVLRRIAGIFGRGLLVFVPTVGTIYTLWLVLSWLDDLIGVPIPGLGLLITLGVILAVGALSSNVAGEAIVAAFEAAVEKVPFVRLLYTSLKDLLGAFVGDKKSFDQPAMIAIDGEGATKVFGFVTCEVFDDPRLRGHVAVYLPQAYNFAGNVIVVPKERVQRVDADPAQFMAFILSGGVSNMSGARTVMDSASLTARTSWPTAE